MQIEFLTKSDLTQFKNELITEVKSLLNPNVQPRKKWLKSNEVREIYGCSHGTLQNLRIRGDLKPSKVGGIWYYPADQVYSLLEKGIDRN
jgi:hypothetical protein